MLWKIIELSPDETLFVSIKNCEQPRAVFLLAIVEPSAEPLRQD